MGLEGVVHDVGGVVQACWRLKLSGCYGIEVAELLALRLGLKVVEEL